MARITHEADRPRKPWRVDWTETVSGRRRRPSKRFVTEEEALAWVEHLARGPQAGAARLRLEDYLFDWYSEHGPGWAKRTRRDRRYALERFIVPYLGRARLGELTRPEVRRWRAEMLAHGATPKVANDTVRVLSAALGAAVRDDTIGINPCTGLKPLPEPPVDREPATLDQVEAIRAEMPTAADRLAVSLLAYAGLRPGELRTLQVRDLRPKAVRVMRAADDDGAIKRTKTGSIRVVHLLGVLADDIADAGLPSDPDALVCPQTGDWDNWTAKVWRPRRAAGECDAVPYSLRHTYASLMIAEGRNQHEVARLLGHATPQLTLNTYGHLFAEAQLSDGEDVQAAAAAARLRAPRLRAEREDRRARIVAALPGTAIDLVEAAAVTDEQLRWALAYLMGTRPRAIEEDPGASTADVAVYRAWARRKPGPKPRQEPVQAVA